MAEALRSVTACFTGHRPERLPADLSYLRMALDAAMEGAIRMGYVHYISGMSRGFDLLAADAVVRARAKHPEIRLECALPCIDQTRLWKKDAELAEYQRLLDAADTVSCLQKEYTAGCMHERNKYMVEHAAAVIAWYDGGPGGTADTVRLAQKAGLRVLNLNPDQPSLERLC